MRRSKKKKKYIILKVIGVVSTVVFLVFSIMLYLLDMIPNKYLFIIYGVLGFIYFILLLFTFIRKIKRKIKYISCLLFIIFGVIFGIGIKYIGDTINFVDLINNDLLQKEVYYLYTLDSSSYTTMKQFNNKTIGIYKSKNSESAIEELNKKIKIESLEYESVVDLFDELSDKKIDGVLINESTKNLLSSELSDLDISIKEIGKIYVSIKKKDIVKVVDVTRKPFNIYVAGGDAYGSIDNVTNTDVNMLITVDPVKRKVLLTSIPRDYYVNLSSFGEDAYDKLTHAGYYGIEESVKAVENLLDTDINYFVKVNFSTIEGVIDAIDGIDVVSDYTFKEDAFKKYTFKKGLNHMNGHMALAFARERKSFKDGDIQRVKNQQLVLQAIIKKVTSSTKLVTGFSKILDSVSKNFSTNMDTESINKFVKMQLRNMQGWEIETQNLVGTDFYTKNTYTYPSLQLYVMKKNEESVNDAQIKIKEYFK